MQLVQQKTPFTKKAGGGREKQTIDLFTYSLRTRHGGEGVRLVLRLDSPVRVNAHNVHARTRASRRYSSRPQSTIIHRRLQKNLRTNQTRSASIAVPVPAVVAVAQAEPPSTTVCTCPGTKSQLLSHGTRGTRRTRGTRGVSSSLYTHQTLTSFGTMRSAKDSKQAVAS